MEFEDRTFALTWRTFEAEPPPGWSETWHEYVRGAGMEAVGEPVLEWYDEGHERMYTVRGSCRGELASA